MYTTEVRRRALALIDSGSSLRSVSAATGISRSTLRDWRDHRDKATAMAGRECPRCAEHPTLPEPAADYAYLLGLYLGDGCISPGGDGSKAVWRLRVLCCDAWPGLIEECVRAMRAVRPASKVLTQQKQGCTEVSSYSKHWPCLFPQHGPGKKHARKLELAPWQQVIVGRHPGDFARGLFHSDGYRGMNPVRRMSPDGERRYEYPRYLFTNESADILRFCGAALDRLGVAWRLARPDVISVARRDAVARLDEFVGPKY
jgi:hypothetical protein